MIRNYFKIAYRNLMKHRFISFINLFGLTIGLTCCLLIVSYILHETSYDKHHPQPERTYRLSRTFLNNDGVQSLHLGAIAPPFGAYMKNYFPEVEKMTRLLSNGKTAFRNGDKKFYEQNVFFADENLTDVFKVDVLRGNAKKALSTPYSVMITDVIAKKYFGNEDPINKTVNLDNQLVCNVSGIFKPFPSNTHVHPEVLIAFNTLEDSVVYGKNNLLTNWGNNSFLTYVVLPKGYAPRKMEKGFDGFLDKYMHFPGEPPGFIPSKTSHIYLTPVTDIHLRSHLDYEIEENGDIKRVYIFSAIALFILLIACINYMNLSTARSVLRAKEIGIRKTVGAEKKEIIWQFLSESVLVAWIAILLAFLLTMLLLPWLNKFSGQDLSIGILLKWQVIIPLLATPFIVGIIAGIYPAMFMSSFQPIKVLKGVFKVGGNISLRKALVVTQFAISIILMISTGIVLKQLKYMQDKSLGFDKDRVITMNNSNAFNNTFESFRNELMRTGYVKDVGRSSRIPSGKLLDNMGLSVPAGDTTRQIDADLKFLAVDYNFIPTYGIPVVAGRNFSNEFASDSSGYIINEASISAVGFRSPQDAIGKEIIYGGTRGRIIGVMKNFHFESMHRKILPMILLVNGRSYGNISIKLSGDLPSALAAVEKKWREFAPDAPWDYSFIDERFEKLYEAEHRQGTIFSSFAFIAIFVACLGLFGLSAFSITQRVKEIGIRKVLGATIQNIVLLLSKDFLLLVFIAAVIGGAVAGVAMDKWLHDFAYRIPLPWWVFVAAMMIAGLVAFFTISLQAVKAAASNPVKNLRTE